MALPDFKHVIFTPDRVGDHWINKDAQRFAVVPASGIVIAERKAAEVEMLLSELDGTPPGAEGDGIVADLLKLHAKGNILWPMGALFHHSVLGRVDIRRLEAQLRVASSGLLHLLDAFQKDSDSPFAAYKEPQKRAFAFSTWKTLLAVRLATSKPLTTLQTYEHDDFEALADVVRPDGTWVDWFTLANRKGVQYAARHLAQRLDNRHFGASIGRAINPELPGPRRRDPFDFCPHLAWLDTLYEQHLDETKILMKKGRRHGKRLLGDFFATLPPASPSRVETAFNQTDMRQLRSFASTWSTPIQRVQAMSQINDFINFIELKLDLGQIKTSGGIQLGLEKHEVDHFVRSVHIPRRASLSGEVHARPMPTRYHLRLKEIITADNFAWPKSLRSAVNGRPLHWVPWRDPKTGRSSEIFCPVLARVLLLQLDLPLRNVQARRLDSGEGDTERWNPETRAWERNVGPHGAYWERIGSGNPRRGCIRRIPTGDGRHLTGIWVNSNKTQDREVLFDDTAGYEIPWEHADVLQNLASMRAWQERYNSVDGPLPHAEVPRNIFQDEPSEAVRALIPDRYYLFRYPQNPGKRGREAPPSYAATLQFFLDALEELERRLREEDPERPVTIITERDRSGAPKQSIFTLHGMRASTLTGLHLAGVPVEILSKVVAGHASILMTLNYIKLDPLHVSQVLTDARLRAADEAKTVFPDLIRNADMEQAVRMTARLADDGLHQMKGAYDEPSAWLRLDIGLCPNGGTLCRIGGEAIHKRNDRGTDKSAYRPVPGGARNCVRCRFFVRGLPFLIPLWAHSAAIMARANAVATQAADREREVRELKLQRRNLIGDRQPVPLSLVERITVTDELWISDCDRRDQILADLHATLALVEKVRAISHEPDDADGGSQLPMLLPGEAIPELVARESTRFEVSDAVVQASRCFPSLESDDIERERDEFLNQILYRNGYVPVTMAPLSRSERRNAADAMATLLLVELGATETEHLVSGRKSLADLGLQAGLEAACRKAVGKPMLRIGMGPSAKAPQAYLDLSAAE